MEETTVNPASPDRRGVPLGRLGLLALILLVLVAAVFAYRTWTGRQTATTGPAAERISAGELEERYGLRVRLIGVTAGGGMIDFRLKILDAQKARRFLQDPANLPRLVVTDSGTALMAPEGIEDNIEWEEGGILFVLFPNSNGVIKPGTAVTVDFGGLQLEPILAQ